jgi:hypothetical protein
MLTPPENGRKRWQQQSFAARFNQGCRLLCAWPPSYDRLVKLPNQAATTSRSIKKAQA